MKELFKKLEVVKAKYAHWNKKRKKGFLRSDCSDCGDIGSDCHNDGECGGDGE